MRIFALYLPQFHRIPENDKWWGEGFTEWEKVRKARPLYKGHSQPKHPLNDNYYNLLDYETVKWQTDLMHTYKISGMIYYHYYFNGKLLLEKPAEQLLEWKDIDQPFFFCWANHTWNRSWNGTKEILIKQEYGGIEDWKKHFEYLLPFFKDRRYEKIDNKPLFVLYDEKCPVKNKMFAMFDLWCKEAGFDGIQMIFEKFRFGKNSSDTKVMNFYSEPSAGRLALEVKRGKLYIRIHNFIDKMNQKGILHHIKKYDGNKIYSQLITQKRINENDIPGIFFEWDNTPRHGQRGYIITPVDKTTFMKYMDTIKNSKYAIVNAWNEWAEGMILEPTAENGYKYLEWIKEWKDNEDRI